MHLVNGLARSILQRLPGIESSSCPHVTGTYKAVLQQSSHARFPVLQVLIIVYSLFRCDQVVYPTVQGIGHPALMMTGVLVMLDITAGPTPGHGYCGLNRLPPG